MMPGRRPVTEHRRLALANNRERLAQVYREYQPHTVRYIARRVEPQHSHAVEDLAQETFLRAWPDLHKVQPRDGGSLHGWLSTIARYRVASYYRPDRPNAATGQHAAETPIATDSPFWGSRHLVDQSATANADAVEDRLDLHAALPRLSAEARQVLEMRYLRGLSRDAVAKQLHHSKDKIDKLTDEGLTGLRGMLGDIPHVRESAAAIAETTDSMVCARQAVAEVHRRVAEGEPRHVGQPVPAPAECRCDEFADSMARARAAVAQAHQRVAQGADRGADEAARAEQLARWHAATEHRAPEWGAQ